MMPQSSCNTPIPPCMPSFHLFSSYQLGYGSRERPRLKQPRCPQPMRPITNSCRAPNTDPLASLIMLELGELLRGNIRHNSTVRGCGRPPSGKVNPVRPLAHTPTLGLSHPFVPHSLSQPPEEVCVWNISIQWIGLMGEKDQKNIGSFISYKWS